MENPEDLEHIISLHWPHLFASIDPNTPITLTKISSRNWLISSPLSSSSSTTFILKSSSSSSIDSLDFELQYLIDLNRFFSNEYRVPIPLVTSTGQYHANGKYWLYEFIDGQVYPDNDTTHLFDEKELISLAKCISKYHQFLLTHSPSLATNKRTTTREHLLEELKQAAESIPSPISPCLSLSSSSSSISSSSSSSMNSIGVLRSIGLSATTLPIVTTIAPITTTSSSSSTTTATTATLTTPATTTTTIMTMTMTSPITTSALMTRITTTPSSNSSAASTKTSTSTTIDLVSQYFVGCYPLLCRLLRDSLSRQQKTNIIRSYPIHRNLRPSKVIWSFDGHVLGLLDFENVNHDTLWRDLAVCLSTFCTSSSPSIITDVDRMRIFIEEYMKQMSGGTARVSSQTEQEVFQLIVDEIILCAIEDFTFIYWQYIHQRDKFQGLKAMEFYYKRALWHAEHALKK